MPTMMMTTSAAYQFTGICPRYDVPPPVAAARATDFPVELLAMGGRNPTAWTGPPWLQGSLHAPSHETTPSSWDGVTRAHARSQCLSVDPATAGRLPPRRRGSPPSQRVD